MSSRMNGYLTERENRPSSEQMADLHVYIVPPDIWREKYHNALNQNINETVSIGFIRVHPETKIYALRDEIEQQLGTELVPREYVFVKSVGRSLTRLKARQEAQLKVKNFLPPQAYAPELYLLEATPEVRQQIAASSEGSTRPQTRTSYDYDYARQIKGRQNHYQYGNPSQHHPASSSRQQQQQSAPQEEYLQPLSATPPHTDSEKDKHSHRNRHGNHGNSGSQHKHDEDSGIAGFTPDTYRENDPLDRRKGNTDQNDRLKAPSPEESGPLNQSQDENEMSEWDRRRQEEQERARKEEEERLKEEEDEKRRAEQDREDIAEQAKMMRTNSDEDLKQYPSPPPLRLASPERDSESARALRRKQKEELLKDLEKAREARKASERQREELVKHAKQMQTKTQNKRNHARDLWKKRYFEEKKKTGPLEEQCNRLRHELDIIHKKLLTTLEGPKEKATKLSEIKPSNKVGSHGRPLVSSDFQHSRSRTTSPATSPAPGGRGDNSKNVNETEGGHSLVPISPIREGASPFMDGSKLEVVSPARTRSLSPLRIVSPNMGRKPYSFRAKPSPSSPWRSFQKPPIVSKRELKSFENKYMKSKRPPKQYPVALMGSNQKQAYLDNEQFDSDYDSSQSSLQSIRMVNGRLLGSPRKNVQFNRNINVIPQEN